MDRSTLTRGTPVARAARPPANAARRSFELKLFGVAALAAAAVGGCVGGPSAPPRDLSMPTAFCSDGADGGPPATLESVETVLAARCAIVGCHDADPLAASVMLDLRRGRVIASVVRVAAREADGGCGTRVVPGDAGASYLYQKLSSDTPCDGLRMPRCEIGSCPLPDCEIEIIRRWINAGAR